MAVEMKSCLILGSAPVEDASYVREFLEEAPYVICADGGLDLARRCGIRPDLIVGDFDSLQGSFPADVECVRLPVMKDDTDTMAAVKIALERGYESITLAGVLGGRLDHTFANFCVLQFIQQQGGKGQMADEATRVFYLSGGKLTLRQLKGKTVSVFPFACHRCVVSYTGLLYPLTKHALYTDVSPMGVSNEITEEEATILVHEGNALIMVLMENT